jgi:hypothetical protein
MSSMVNPASATAASQACTVSTSGSTISRRPMSDMPMPVMATSSSNLRVPIIGRTPRRTSSALGSSSGRAAGSGCSSVGRNSGSQVSSAAWSNSTCMRMPSTRSSGSTPTKVVVSLTRGSSSSATCPVAYGEGSPGSWNRWLTVNPNSVAYPDTSRTARSWLRQYGQIGLGGCTRPAQEPHACTRSVPSSPDFQ